MGENCFENYFESMTYIYLSWICGLITGWSYYILKKKKKNRHLQTDGNKNSLSKKYVETQHKSIQTLSAILFQDKQQFHAVSLLLSELNVQMKCGRILSQDIKHSIASYVWNFPHLVVVVCVSWGRRFALWRRCRPGSHCKALYSYWGFFSVCWWLVGLYAAPVPVSSGGSNRWQSPLPCLKNGCWTPYTQSTDRQQQTAQSVSIIVPFLRLFLCSAAFEMHGWWSKISTHHDGRNKTLN